MNYKDVHRLYETEMSDNDFLRLSGFIFSEYGIKLPAHKKLMLQGRLRARLRARSKPSFAEYIEYLFSSEGQQTELVHMIDVVTTNKTDFFREPDHFDYLYNNILPEFHLKSVPGRKFRIWSAGCSTGEEPYTLAIILSEFKALYPRFDFEILGTDISSRALDQARLAIYPENKVSVIPLSLKKNYLLRSKDKARNEVRISAEVRSRVLFERHNLMDIPALAHDHFDVIFCRNTLIYFDRGTQLRVVANLSSKLQQGAYLFIGHSESIVNEQILPLRRVRPTIYTRVKDNFDKSVFKK